MAKQSPEWASNASISSPRKKTGLRAAGSLRTRSRSFSQTTSACAADAYRSQGIAHSPAARPSVTARPLVSGRRQWSFGSTPCAINSGMSASPLRRGRRGRLGRRAAGTADSGCGAAPRGRARRRAREAAPQADAAADVPDDPRPRRGVQHHQHEHPQRSQEKGDQQNGKQRSPQEPTPQSLDRADDDALGLLHDDYPAGVALTGRRVRGRRDRHAHWLDGGNPRPRESLPPWLAPHNVGVWPCVAVLLLHQVWGKDQRQFCGPVLVVLLVRVADDETAPAILVRASVHQREEAVATVLAAQPRGANEVADHYQHADRASAPGRRHDRRGVRDRERVLWHLAKHSRAVYLRDGPRRIGRRRCGSFRHVLAAAVEVVAEAEVLPENLVHHAAPPRAPRVQLRAGAEVAVAVEYDPVRPLEARSASRAPILLPPHQPPTELLLLALVPVLWGHAAGQRSSQLGVGGLLLEELPAGGDLPAETVRLSLRGESIQVACPLLLLLLGVPDHPHQLVAADCQDDQQYQEWPDAAEDQQRLACLVHRPRLKS